MGPKASTPADNNTAIKINHPLFALAKLVKDKEDQEFIQTEVRLANQKQFDAWAKRVDDFPANESLMIPTGKQYKQEGMCGSSGVAHLSYENFPYLLSDEITNRDCLNKKLFEENELWYLVYTLLSAAFTYHRQGTKVGDIRPDNIFINEDGQVKVASVDSWPNEQTNYEKSFYQKQITYLSPQQIKDYQFGKLEQSVDKELAETFSIGLTCLDAATLSESKTLYSKNFKFNYEKLETRLSQFRKYGYSELLTLAIENMCEVDTQFRSSSRQILQWLLPHQEAIINLEDFQVAGLPQKMKLVRERNQGIQNQQQPSQIMSSQLHYQGSTYTPPVYAMQPGVNIASSYQPVQFMSYQQGPGMINIKPQQISTIPTMISQPSSYQVNNMQPHDPFVGNQGTFNYYAVNSTTNGDNSHLSALQRIDQQLQQSRKLFPS